MTSGISQFGLVFSLLIGLALSQSHASETMVPESIPGVETLSAESLILLGQSVEDLKLIDSRLQEDRSIGYIEDAISLPDIETSCKTLKKIISYPSQPTVIYSNGVQCGRSVMAINKASECGYTRLYWFKGGFEEWQKRDYPYMLD